MFGSCCTILHNSDYTVYCGYVSHTDLTLLNPASSCCVTPMVIVFKQTAAHQNCVISSPITLVFVQTAAYQRKLMRVAVQLLKPGGHLVYSTCTINPGKPMQLYPFQSGARSSSIILGVQLQILPRKLMQHISLNAPAASSLLLCLLSSCSIFKLC